MESTVTGCLLTPDDWRVLRDVRLEALLDSPHAFTSNYAQESEWAEPEWRAAFAAATWMVAYEAGRVIALAKSIEELERPFGRHLESIWVAPTHRKRGVFRALLDEIAAKERRDGVTDLLLWVLDDNHDALAAYLALGFEPTGECQPLPAGQQERRLKLSI
jgi:GNAT superfamily N-acetyltransferase